MGLFRQPATVIMGGWQPSGGRPAGPGDQPARSAPGGGSWRPVRRPSRQPGRR